MEWAYYHYPEGPNFRNQDLQLQRDDEGNLLISHAIGHFQKRVITTMYEKVGLPAKVNGSTDSQSKYPKPTPAQDVVVDAKWIPRLFMLLRVLITLGFIGG